MVKCNSNEILVGGGASCYSNSNQNGYFWLKFSKPWQNGWFAGCDSPKNRNENSDIYAICLHK